MSLLMLPSLLCCTTFVVFSAAAASSSAITTTPLLFARPPRKRQPLLLQLQQQTTTSTANNDGIVVEVDNNNDDSPIMGMYVHIPYCRRRCNYCDFAIVPVGDISSSSSSNSGFTRMNYEYTNAIINEIKMISLQQKKKQRLHSIYFGGGTPSLAPINTLRHILSAIHDTFHSNNNNNNSNNNDTTAIEITIEMDPGTFNLDYLTSIKELGFNRISLGVQSFDNTLLSSSLGRVHTVQDIYDSVQLINTVFGSTSSSSSRPNYSIDLISGIPGLTLAQWTDTLYKAVHTLHPSPTHVSLYDLQIEDGTVFSQWYNKKNNDNDNDKGGENRNKRSSRHVLASPSPPLTLPSSNDSAFMYSYASGYLRHLGYEHYEISSYALSATTTTTTSPSLQQQQQQQKSFYRSKHNQIYWDYNGQWHAVGLGATSNVNNMGGRFVRPRALSDYITWIEELQRMKNANAAIIEAKTPPPPPPLPNSGESENDNNNNNDDKLLDIIMTRLRTSDGLDLDWIITQNEYNESHIHAILSGFDLAIELDLGQRYNNCNPVVKEDGVNGI